MGDRIGLAVNGTTGMPTRTGIPFPEGALTDVKNLRLLSASGTESPCQADVTGRWADGSVRWALLDFVADG
ncbi:MAG: hypothetical protein QF834_07445, partial [Candidatus Thalassarchaeaceae archaeon]|nr:hypothetical protein [Candidatus Thalassarchaeaceae archaeon]